MFLKNVFAAATLASSAFAAPTASNGTKKLEFFGINESGAEFGQNNFTGVYNKEYTWYDFNAMDQFMAQGMNMFRFNFRKTPPQATLPPHPKLLHMYPNQLQT
jgi:endoglucanase